MRSSAGRIRGGQAVVGKIDLSAAVEGERIGLPGFSTYAHYFYRTDGHPSGDLVGDAQGVDNIEADARYRLLEVWAEQRVGHASLPGGLMNLHVEFDSIEPAHLFLNSAHGIGTEFARSGVNGPSIYPTAGDLRRRVG